MTVWEDGVGIWVFGLTAWQLAEGGEWGPRTERLSRRQRKGQTNNGDGAKVDRREKRKAEGGFKGKVGAGWVCTCDDSVGLWRTLISCLYPYCPRWNTLHLSGCRGLPYAKPYLLPTHLGT
ncbi:hypothetical protein LZ32DRAFT_611121 [Colletotrichum eremochloae]|nr:hypothetical protein LZ32DRAFT_611121 [Colletotrichum eremochloae]